MVVWDVGGRGRAGGGAGEGGDAAEEVGAEREADHGDDCRVAMGDSLCMRCY